MCEYSFKECHPKWQTSLLFTGRHPFLHVPLWNPDTWPHPCKGSWKLLYLGSGVWWQGGHHLWATSCLCRCGPAPQTAKWRSSYMTHSIQWPSLSPAQLSSLTTARKLTLAKGQQSLGVLLSQSQDHLLQAWLAFARRLLRCSSLVSAITLHVSA